MLVIELHDTSAAVMRELNRHGYEACLFGSRVPIEHVSGNVHAAAVPSERANCGELLERFRNPGFPRCERCLGTEAVGIRWVTALRGGI